MEPKNANPALVVGRSAVNEVEEMFSTCEDDELGSTVENITRAHSHIEARATTTIAASHPDSIMENIHCHQSQPDGTASTTMRFPTNRKSTKRVALTKAMRSAAI